MMRKVRATGTVLVMTLVVAACGGGGSKTLSEDDYIDGLNGLCSDVTRGASRLDPTDRNFFDDALELFEEAKIDLAELKPPSSLQRDHRDIQSNLDDTIAAFEDYRDAVDDSDADAVQDAQADLDDLSKELNDIADDIGADDCVDVGFSGETPNTTPDTTPTSESTPDTTPVTTPETTETTTANTPLPIPTTTPNTTATTPPPMTVPPTGGDGQGQSAADSWAPPAGWSWIDTDPTTWTTPFEVPTIAATLTGYWIGLAENSSTGQRAFIFISESSAQWTADQVNAIWNFEGVGAGADTQTPQGLVARVVVDTDGSGQYDTAVAILAVNSITVWTTTGGTDLGTLLDDIFIANSM